MFIVGDYVEDRVLGYGKVIEVVNCKIFPIKCIFKQKQKGDSYEYTELGQFELRKNPEIRKVVLPDPIYKVGDELVITVKGLDLINVKTRVLANINGEDIFLPIMLEEGNCISGDGKYYYNKETNEVYSLVVLKIGGKR